MESGQIESRPFNSDLMASICECDLFRSWREPNLSMTIVRLFNQYYTWVPLERTKPSFTFRKNYHCIIKCNVNYAVIFPTVIF